MTFLSADGEIDEVGLADYRGELLARAAELKCKDIFKSRMTVRVKELKKEARSRKCNGSTSETWTRANLEGKALNAFTFGKFCNIEGFNFRWNEISHDIEYYGFGRHELKDTLANTAVTILRDRMEFLNMEKVTPDNISSFMLLHASRNAFNPVLEIINSVKWDGVDRLNELYSMWHITDPFERCIIRKWLVQCYCMLHNTLENAISSEFVLIFKGAQGAAKTQFFGHLAIKDAFFKDGATLDPDNKDTMLEAYRVWICELGELGSTMKKDRDKLKAEITRAIDRIREPYARAANSYPRRTSFCATVNDDKFLIDETGNRRWAIVRLEDNLKVKYSDVKKFNSLQLWAQIAQEVEEEIMVTKGTLMPTTYSNAFRLTEDEAAEVDRRARQCMKPLKAEEAVADIIEMFESDRPFDGYELVHKPISATEFIVESNKVAPHILDKYGTKQVGEALRILGYENKQHKVNGTNKRGYLLPCWEKKSG